MAVTHHCKNKTSAMEFRRKKEREGFGTSMHKTEHGWSVTVYKK
jgi:hypothetical protein